MIPSVEEHRQEVEQWHRKRLDRLRSPNGWLSLVDRILLEPGETALPIGTAILTGEEVQLRVAPGVTVTDGGSPITEVVLRASDGGASQALLSGGRSYELIRRGPAFAIRVKDPRAPALQEFESLGARIDRYPVDPAFRVVARFDRYEPPRTTRLSFDLGEGPLRTVPGAARFELGGQQLSLEPVVEEDAQRLFFVFGDETNRRDTYPGGRFLYAALPPAGEAQPEVVLDFNLAFNAPCAFTEFATCPAIPMGNRLPLAVTAGERRYSAPSASA